MQKRHTQKRKEKDTHLIGLHKGQTVYTSEGPITLIEAYEESADLETAIGISKVHHEHDIRVNTSEPDRKRPTLKPKRKEHDFDVTISIPAGIQFLRPEFHLNVLGISNDAERIHHTIEALILGACEPIPEAILNDIMGKGFQLSRQASSSTQKANIDSTMTKILEILSREKPDLLQAIYKSRKLMETQAPKPTVAA